MAGSTGSPSSGHLRRRVCSITECPNLSLKRVEAPQRLVGAHRVVVQPVHHRERTRPRSASPPPAGRAVNTADLAAGRQSHPERTGLSAQGRSGAKNACPPPLPVAKIPGRRAPVQQTFCACSSNRNSYSSATPRPVAQAKTATTYLRVWGTQSITKAALSRCSTAESVPTADSIGRDGSAGTGSAEARPPAA